MLLARLTIPHHVIQSLEAVRSETTYCVLAKDLVLYMMRSFGKLRMTYSVQDDRAVAQDDMWCTG